MLSPGELRDLARRLWALANELDGTQLPVPVAAAPLSEEDWPPEKMRAWLLSMFDYMAPADSVAFMRILNQYQAGYLAAHPDRQHSLPMNPASFRRAMASDKAYDGLRGRFFHRIGPVTCRAWLSALAAYDAAQGHTT